MAETKAKPRSKSNPYKGKSQDELMEEARNRGISVDDGADEELLTEKLRENDKQTGKSTP